MRGTTGTFELQTISLFGQKVSLGIAPCYEGGQVAVAIFVNLKHYKTLFFPAPYSEDHVLKKIALRELTDESMTLLHSILDSGCLHDGSFQSAKAKELTAKAKIVQAMPDIDSI